MLTHWVMLITSPSPSHGPGGQPFSQCSTILIYSTNSDYSSHVFWATFAVSLMSPDRSDMAAELKAVSLRIP